jgi:hypothetical protein
MPYIGKKPADIIATAVDTTTGTFSGDLTVDTSTLYVDSANNRVGVGTTSLTNVLHVHQTDATSNSYVHITQADGGSGATDGLSIGIEDGGVNAVIRNRENGYLRMYTNNTERMRIDSSGNLLVGKTASAFGTGGIEIRGSDDASYFTRSGNAPVHINRLSSDGEIVRFNKDSSLVGSIGANSTQLIIGGTNTGIRFTGSQLNPMDMTSQTLVDNSKDIGSSSYRWKDLYLSGKLTNNGTGGINIDTSGNVGIGTSSPDNNANFTALTVKSTSGSGGGQVYVESSGAKGVFGADNAGSGAKVILYTINADDPLMLGTANTERMRISSAGNVGIGNLGNAATLLHIGSTGTPEFRVQDLDSGGGYLTVTHGAGVSTISADPTNSSGSPTLVLKTNNSERARIDNSGNLLVGKTSTGLSVTGTQITSDGRAMFTRDGNQAADFNRKTSDGDIVKFHKDSTLVGSIGVATTTLGTNPYIAGSSGRGLSFDLSSNTIFPCGSDGARADGSANLGVSSARFNDLYLSGGVYLGGTGSANLLDDYEEGTFTSSPAVGSYTFNNPTYTKIGRMVNCQAQIGSISENSSSTSFTVDLPFTAAASNRAVVFGTLYVNISRNPIVGGYLNSTSTLMIYLDNSFTQLQHTDTASNTSIYIAFAYEAAS